MRAVVVEQTGGPEVLRVEASSARAGPGRRVVDVAAAGVNFIDVYERTGGYPKELPFVLGSRERAPSAVGDGVTDVAVGDRVAWAMVPGTGYTEQAAVPAERVVRVPRSRLRDGSGRDAPGMTAHYLCESTYPARSGRPRSRTCGRRGRAAADPDARRQGSARDRIPSTEEKAELARGAGADEVVNYTEADVVGEIRRLTDGRRWRWCTTAWAGRPSTRASTVCGLAA